MAGIYLHIPFCRKACTYCNFHFSTSLLYQPQMVEALKQELLLAQEQHPAFDAGTRVNTVYFGGGTPSVLEVEAVAGLLQSVHRLYSVSADAEITLEANPDDCTPEKLNAWRALGINRLSVGVQSIDDRELAWMNRAHNAVQSRNIPEQLYAAGFTNYSIDLIYGSPLLTNEQWLQHLNWAGAAAVPHLSCYALTVEPQTPLQKHIKQGQSADTDPNKQAEQFILLSNWLEANGYQHYEISNAALPGMQSRHNSSYWHQVPYLGIGPSAHGFNGTQRMWNVANNQQYIRSIGTGLRPVTVESLSVENQHNEYVMTALRLLTGVQESYVSARFGQAAWNRLLVAAQPYLKANHIKLVNGSMVLTPQGRLQADGIAAHLFW